MLISLNNRLSKMRKKKIIRLQTFDLSYVLGKTFSGNDGSQNNFVFHSLFNLRKLSNLEHVKGTYCRSQQVNLENNLI